MSDITELAELELDRLDAVGAPANGTAWLVLKAQEAGDLGKGTVADDADAERAPLKDEKELSDEEDTDEDPLAQSKLTAEGGMDFPDAAGIQKEADDGVPGSPSWEANDGAMMLQAARMLAQVKEMMIEPAKEREMTEYSSGAEDDPSDVMGLMDACDKVCGAIGILAQMALLEEAQGLMVKAGRKLSAASAESVHTAISTLTSLLGEPTMPEEGTEMTKEEIADLVASQVADELAKATAPKVEDVVKEEAVTEEVAKEEEAAPVEALVKEDLLAALREAIAPVAEAVAEQSERLATVEKMAAPSKAHTGAIGSSVVTRGDATPESQLEKLKKAVQDAKTPEATDEAWRDLSLAHLSAVFNAQEGLG